MASYADYSAQTMASDDFTLYPDAESWNPEQSYLPTSTYADQPYLSATTFDSSFQAPQQYSDCTFEQTPQHAKEPFHSPAHSTSHSFDYQNPPRFSTTSDSGHSTISSAMGSPSAQMQPSEWNHHLNLFPDIVQHNDNGVFAATTFEYDSIPVTDKGCVGESSSISSSQQLQSTVLSDAPLFSTSTAEVQNVVRDHFRSPTTPASATSPGSAIEYKKCSSNATTASTTPRCANGRRFSHTPSSSHFFSQSSGYFVPPLESSCPFSPTSCRISYSSLLFSLSLSLATMTVRVHELTK